MHNATHLNFQRIAANKYEQTSIEKLGFRYGYNLVLMVMTEFFIDRIKPNCCIEILNDKINLLSKENRLMIMSFVQ